MKISRLLAVLLIQLSLIACSSGGVKSPDHASFVLSGTISGLTSGTSLVLSDAAGSTLTANKNGSFQFTNQVPFGSSYDVTVATQPVGESCTVSGTSSGTAIQSDISNLVVTCTPQQLTIGGTLSGLATGTNVALQNNKGSPLKLSGNGSFVFNQTISYDGSYDVTVSTQPTGQICSPAYNTGSGSGVKEDVTDVQIVCSTQTYSISGTVSGLAAGASVTLYNNGTDTLTIKSNGNFTFSTPIAYGGSYQVIVATQPSGQTCSVANSTGTGANVSADVTNVTIVCSTETFTVGGTVTGLVTGQSVTLLNNGSDADTINANGSFSFSTGIAYGGSYKVTISGQPTGQACTAASASGSDVTSAVNDVTVTCTSNTYTVAGSVSGLDSSTFVTLLDNGSDPITVSANGSFEFGAAVASGSNYNVSVARQPTGEACTVSNGSGAITASDVTDVSVSCAASNTSGTSTNAYTVGGTVSGLPLDDTLVLSNSLDGDSIAINESGSFAFPTVQTTGASYYTLVEAQPSGAYCTVTGGSGTVGTSDVSSVAVNCTLTSGSAAAVYTIGGTVSGLPQGSSVVLSDSANGDAVTLSANGNYSFPISEPSGFAYSIVVQSAPAGETCTISGGAGYVGIGPVTNILVSCSLSTDTWSVGGNVNWGSVTSGTFTISLGGSNYVEVSAPNTSFSFPFPLATGSNYVASITIQPGGSTCYIASGSAGYAITADVSDIEVNCSPQLTTYPLTINVSGLPAKLVGGLRTYPDKVNLSLNGQDELFSEGTQNWSVPLTGGAQYTLRVVGIIDTSTSPATQVTSLSCSVSDGSFTATAPISETVLCGTPSYTIGGTVHGLPASATSTPYSVTLYESSGGDYVSVSGCTACTSSQDEQYTFPNPLPTGSAYAVTVSTQPALGTTNCTVSNGTGTVSGANVTTVDVTCPPPTWSVGGTVSGLPNSDSVVLDDTDNGTSVTVTNSSSPKYPSFTIDQALATGTQYNVVIKSSPSGYVCSISNGSGTVPDQQSTNGVIQDTNVSNVQVSCVSQPLFVSGTVTWNNAQSTAASNVSINLLLNGTYAYTISGVNVPAATTSNGTTTDGTANSSFKFSQSLTYGTAWAVSEQTVTSGWQCQFANASGSSITANVTNVQVTCTN